MRRAPRGSMSQGCGAGDIDYTNCSDFGPNCLLKDRREITLCLGETPRALVFEAAVRASVFAEMKLRNRSAYANLACKTNPPTTRRSCYGSGSGSSSSSGLGLSPSNCRPTASNTAPMMPNMPFRRFVARPTCAGGSGGCGSSVNVSR